MFNASDAGTADCIFGTMIIKTNILRILVHNMQTYSKLALTGLNIPAS